jgi:hypothetical protein
MGSTMRVCSTTHLYHYFFEPAAGALDSILEDGIRPLSDFPASERWKQLEEHIPGFYRNVYESIAAPVLEQPYANSGIFVTPVDFRLLPGVPLHDQARFAIPIEQIDPSQAVLTYVLDDERVSLPFSAQHLEETAAIWDGDMVTTWFGLDPTKVLFYVPQVATYQGRIEVSPSEFEPDG